jgi:membrane protease YdiL (CAAX protease family)
MRMNTSHAGGGRVRAYAQFIAAVLYFFVARSLAHRGALGLATEPWRPVVEQAMLVFLLLLGYAGFGFWLDRQMHPVSEQGLPRRQGWPTEAGVGLAVGWASAVVCVLPMLAAGGIAIVLSTQISAWGWLAVDVAFFALAALAEEIAFRGYGFQRFEHAVGPVGASLGFAAFYAIVQSRIPGSNHASVAVSVMLTLLLSTAYVRTRALWLSWGLNFGWKASRALFFGLAVSGVNSYSPVVQGDPMGPFWLTGGGYGLDATWVAFAVLLAALPVVFRVTRDLDYRYNAPVIVPRGIPVDLDAAARRQHEAATRTAEPAVPGLVQIFPAATPLPVARQAAEASGDQPTDSR